MTTVTKIVAYLLLLATMVVMLTPMVWLLAASLKGPEDLFSYLFFAPTLSGHNFRQLFTEIPFLRFLMNSLFVTGVTVLVQLIFASMGGFALAKYEFAGKKEIMVLMLATMTIPAQVMMAPMYELIYRFGLVDTYM